MIVKLTKLLDKMKIVFTMQMDFTCQLCKLSAIQYIFLMYVFTSEKLNLPALKVDSRYIKKEFLKVLAICMYCLL